MSQRPETLVTRLWKAVRVTVVVVVAIFLPILAALVPMAVGLSPVVSVLAPFLTIVVMIAAAGLRRYPIHTFGVRRHVGYAVATEGRCDECGGLISTGERRRYARQLVAFGVPIHTLDWGINTYCYECRTDEGESTGSYGSSDHDYNRERELA